MKTTYKVIIALVLAVAAAVAVRGMYKLSASNSSGEDPTDVYQDMMLTARQMFVEKSDDIQMTALALLDYDDVTIMSDKDGKPWVVDEDGSTVEPESVITGELQPHLDNVFGSYDCGGKVYNIRVTDKAILFYTGYTDKGSVGFLYERELGTVQDFTEMFELSENWKIFYDMPGD